MRNYIKLSFSFYFICKVEYESIIITLKHHNILNGGIYYEEKKQEKEDSNFRRPSKV